MQLSEVYLRVSRDVRPGVWRLRDAAVRRREGLGVRDAAGIQHHHLGSGHTAGKATVASADEWRCQY